MLKFLESRLGLVTFWQTSMSGKHPPKGIGFLRTIGFMALTVMVLQLVSGIALAFHYVPSADLAYDSVRAFEHDVPLGRFTRALHHFGASAFVVLAAVHMARVFFTGAYKAPRELTWLTGVGLLTLVLGFGFTGYLLPWDQKAYFATKVGTEIAGKTPVIGAQLRTILDGGDSVGPPTLTRFYIIHVVLLPIGLLGLLGLHMFLIQRHGVAAPGRPVGDEGEPGPAYFPYHVFKEALAGIAVAAVLFALAWSFDAPLEPMAESSDTGYEPRPDWYFLGMFQLLKLFKGPLEPIGTFWLPTVVLGGAVLLPFIDRTKHRSWRRRPITTTLGVAVIAGIVALTTIGAIDTPENEKTPVHPLGLTNAERDGYLLVRRLRCTKCHTYQDIGGPEKDDDPDGGPFEDIEYDPESIAAILANPKEEIDEEVEMPDFAHVPYEQRHAVGLFIAKLHVLQERAEQKKAEQKKAEQKK